MTISTRIDPASSLGTRLRSRRLSSATLRIRRLNAPTAYSYNEPSSFRRLFRKAMLVLCQPRNSVGFHVQQPAPLIGAPFIYVNAFGNVNNDIAAVSHSFN